MQKIEFIKMHGLGNDFVIIDKRFKNIDISKELINNISDRKSGAGCDQLITISENTSNNHDVSIKIYNPNGDLAEACGNGTRCIAKLLFDENSKSELKIKSDAGILIAKKINNQSISINLGKLSHNWQDIPLIKNIDTLNMPININGFSPGVAVNIGNPHIVFFGNNIEDVDLSSIGPKIENNELFPEKTNVELIEIINDTEIKMRVWERGTGITLACGSGACAAVYAGTLKKLLDNKVEVKLERGSLYVSIENNESIMIGPAETSFHGKIELK